MSLKVLLIAGFVLGAAATVLVVVFSDQLRWLRIGVLLALWAALCAAFAVARSRREAQSVAAREAEITRTYQLELHREVSARREYESAFTDQVRTEAESKHADELAAVRAQLERLTAALSNLLDGDVLVERLTLSAESTRLRGLTEAGRNRLAGLSHPELGRQLSEDDDALDAELVEDELPDTAELEGMTGAAVDSDSAPAVDSDPASTVEVDEADDSGEADDAIEPAASTAPGSGLSRAAPSAPAPSAAGVMTAAAGTGPSPTVGTRRAATAGTAVLDRAENATTARPVLPSQLSAAPRPDAPSTGWTRRHRRDVVQAAAAEAAAAREAAARETAAVGADNEARKSPAEPPSAVQTTPAESPAAEPMAPAGRGGHELDPNADDDAGSARISVAQLLAALGSNAEPSHGRRRAAD